jgi:hypothetical protein
VVIPVRFSASEAVGQTVALGNLGAVAPRAFRVGPRAVAAMLLTAGQDPTFESSSVRRGAVRHCAWALPAAVIDPKPSLASGGFASAERLDYWDAFFLAPASLAVGFVVRVPPT